MSLLKSWLIPGALAVVAVAGLSLYGETEKIEADLTGRALTILEQRDMDWAKITFHGRDATLTGIALKRARRRKRASCCWQNGVCVSSRIKLAFWLRKVPIPGGFPGRETPSP